MCSGAFGADGETRAGTMRARGKYYLLLPKDVTLPRSPALCKMGQPADRQAGITRCARDDRSFLSLSGAENGIQRWPGPFWRNQMSLRTNFFNPRSLLELVPSPADRLVEPSAGRRVRFRYSGCAGALYCTAPGGLCPAARGLRAALGRRRRSQPMSPSRTEDWYYCDNPRGHHPYVASCNSGWHQVPAQPNAAPPQH